MQVHQLIESLSKFRGDKQVIFKFEDYSGDSKWEYEFRTVKRIYQEQGYIVIEIEE